ncbi:non-ribosomal peptide synthetase [Paenibacillus mucilaginosus]|nr:non-ribosomal peptide synthetase [Paenibacillus mucilaginosus]
MNSPLTYPLTYAQRRIWYSTQMSPDSPIANLISKSVITSAIQEGLFARSVSSVIEANEALRIRFLSGESGEPAQYAAPPEPCELQAVDFRGYDHAQEAAEQWLEAHVNECFPLFDTPLYAFTLLRLSDEESWLICKIHHLITDGYSLAMTTNDILETYTLLHAEPDRQLEMRPSYIDYITSEKEYELSSRFRKDRQYWAETFGTLPDPSDLKPYRPFAGSTAARQIRYRLEPELREALKEYGRSRSRSLFTVFLALFSLHIHHMTSNETVVIGTNFTNRTNAKEKKTMGMFTSTTPIRIDVPTHADFHTFLNEVHLQQMSVIRHQRFPFNLIMQLIREKDPDLNRIFSISLQYQAIDVARYDLLGNRTDYVFSGHETDDLVINIKEWQESGEMDINYEFRTDVFGEEEIRLIHRRTSHLLAQILRDDTQPLTALELCDAEERGTLTALQPHKLQEEVGMTFPERFERMALEMPHHTALVHQGRSWTYGELNSAANRIAHLLLGSGLQTEGLVGILMSRSPLMAASILAVWKAGGAYIPLDRDYPAGRILQIMGDAKAEVLLTESGALAEELREALEGTAVLELDRMEETLASCSEANPGLPSDINRLAYVIFTSGSTGKPKGAMVEHLGMMNHMLAKIEDVGIDEHSVVAQNASHCFDISVWQFFVALCTGGRTVIYGSEEVLNPHGFLDAVVHDGITVLEVVPSYLAVMLDALEGAERELPALRILLSTGEALKRNVAERWFRLYPDIPVMNAYGPTEASDDITHYLMRETPPYDTVPVGFPLRGFRIYITDPQGRLCPVGAKGEIWVSGIGVGRGYLFDPQRTEAAFMEDPFAGEPGRRLYKTGDLGRWLPEGAIEFFGRKDHQVKVRGYRIELGEIDNALANHPSVSEAVTLDLTDSTGRTFLCAYYTSPEETDASALKAFLSGKLPYYMVPSHFIRLEEIPVTPNGKIDRKALPRPVSAQEGETGGVRTPLRTEQEKVLSGIWSDILGLPELSAEAHFFELGGDSIQALKIVSRLQQTGWKVGMKDLFQYPTIGLLASHMTREESGKGTEGGQTQAPLAEHGLRPEEVARLSTLLKEGLPGAEVQRVYPMTPLQEAMLFYKKLHPHSGMYTEQLVFTVTGTFDPEAFHASVQMLIDRYCVLRTVFLDAETRPLQIVTARRKAEGFDMDLTHLPGEERRRAADELIREDRARGFDLKRDLLLRYTAIRTGEDTWTIAWTHHHIIMDGWCVSLLLQDLLACYRSLTRGVELDLAPEQPYERFIDWLYSQNPAEAAAYWREKLQGFEQQTGVPKRSGYTGTEGYEAMETEWRLPADLTARLDKLARSQRATLHHLLQTTWGVLLAKYNSVQDVVYGHVVSGRPAELSGVEGMVGLFINTVPVRIRMEENPTLQALLHQVRDQSVESGGRYDHEPLTDIQALTPMGQGLIDHILVLEQFQADQTAVERMFGLREIGFTLSDFQTFEQTNYDLNVILIPGEELRIKFNYNALAYEHGVMKRLGRHWQHILEQMAAVPSVRLSEVRLTDAAEREALLYAFNATNRPYPAEKTLHGLFEEQAAARPDAAALVHEGRTLTYRELNLLASRLALRLRSQGVGPGTFVGIVMERSPELIAGLLGILKSGGAYVPFEPGFPVNRIAGITRLLDIRHMVTQSSLTPLVESVGLEAGCGFAVTRLDSPDLPAEEVPNLPHAGGSGEYAYAIFTSGSTGTPKGVLVRHQPVINLIDWAHRTYGFGPSDRVLFVTSVCFDLSVFDIFGLLAAGGSVHIASEGDVRDPGRLVQLLRDEQITFWDSAPAALSQLLPHLQSLPAQPDSRLRLVFQSGDWIPLTLPPAMKSAFPSANIVSLGGATEAAVWSNSFDIGGIDPAWTSIPYGRPIQNAYYYILDGQLEPCPIGVAGELYIGGDCLADGYHDPELTRASFLPNPFVDSPGARIYKTGDRARFMEDGVIEFLGRVDHQVKIRGYRIELGEIQVQLQAHEAVREAVVLDRKDAQGHQVLCAYFAADREVPPAELRGHLSAQLPSYMIPSYFVQLDALPVTANGKLDRKALPEPAGFIRPGTAYEAPANDTESILTGIWEELLDVRPVGVLDSFLELGGHSLKAQLLALRIHQAFGTEVPLRELLRRPTVRELAAYLGTLDQSGAVRIPAVRLQEHYELSPAQRRLYMIHEMDKKSTAYNMPGALLLEGELDRGRLEASLQSLMSRHESLRTSFHLVDGIPVQRVHEPAVSPLAVLELAEEEIEAALLGFSEPFDLSAAPLVRFALIRIHERKHLLLVDMHHIISDGVSVSHALREIAEGYEGRLPAPLPVQYKDYAAWQNHLLQDGRMGEKADYWLSRFQGTIPVLNLPTDYPRPAFRSFEGGEWEFRADGKLQARLTELAARAGATLNMVLTAAYHLLLAKYTGSDDIVAGSPIAGRPHADLQPIIGMFVNMLPLRTRPEAAKTFMGYLVEVKETALGAYDHQDYPLEELIDRLRLERDASRNPLFDTAFAMQNMEMEPVRAGGLQVTPYAAPSRKAKFDLTLEAFPETEGIRFVLEYASALFKKESAVRLAGHYLHLLVQIADQPEELLGSYELITEAEKAEMLAFLCRPSAAVEPSRSVAVIFEVQAALYPDRPALTHGPVSFTYRELNERANRLARTLRERGVKPDTLVALLTGRSVHMIVGILGILKAGGAYLPIDPQYPEERIAYMLQDSGTGVLLMGSGTAGEAVESFGGLRLFLDREETYHADGSNLVPVNGGSDTAYVIYTSGTTGQPKGTRMTHDNVDHIARNTNYHDIHERDTVLQFSNYAFDGSVFDIFGALLNGARLLLVDSDAVRDLSLLSARIREENVTVGLITTALFHALVDEDIDCLRGMRKILFGGEKASLSHVRRALEQLGPGRLINAYGPTETTVLAAFYPVDRLDPAASSVPIGMPVRGMQLFVVSPEGTLQPALVPGELCIAGRGLSAGYLHHPGLTAEKFVPCPFLEGAKMYRTGDLVRWLPDGTLEYLERMDQQVKIRGHRIELSEIENRLLAHDDIREAIVTAGKDEGGHTYLCAYLVSERTWSIPELREYAGTHLPDYMIPQYFVQLDRLPVTANGKLDRRALPAPSAAAGRGTEYAEPRTAVERKLAEIWSALLGTAVGIDDHFFHLGGDSIKGIQVSARLHKAGLQLEMKQLFVSPTIRQLAPHVKQLQMNIEQGAVTGDVPLSPIQRWFVGSGFTDAHHFNQSVMLYRREGFDEGQLDLIWSMLTEHHDVLRSVFPEWTEGRSRVRGTDAKAFVLETADLRSLEAPEEEIRRRAEALQSGMDPVQGPLVRMGLFRTQEGDHLLIAIHHLVVDGVSWRILIEDFTALLGQSLEGQELELPSKTHAYRDWVLTLEKEAEGEQLQQEQAYWQAKLEGGFAALPVKKQTESLLTGGSEQVSVSLTREQTQRLTSGAHRAYRTEMNDLLLAALGCAVQEWTGGDRIGVWLEGHGRDDTAGLELSRTVGWFTSFYPVVLPVEAEAEEGRLIKAVKEALRSVPRRGAGYGILKYLAPKREDGHLHTGARPEIGFNYMGDLDGALDGGLFTRSRFGTGLEISSGMERRHPLDINGWITDGELTFVVDYHPSELEGGEVRTFAERLQYHLVRLTEHCHARGGTELTPSDLRSGGIGSRELEAVYRMIPAGMELQDVYPLSPMQEGLLFHARKEPSSPAYFQQLTLTLEGDVDPELLELSFADLAARHDMFRTVFLYESLERPLQAVLAHRTMPRMQLLDLRALDEEAIGSAVKRYEEAERERGFDLSLATPMRLGLIRTGERTSRLVWSFHHLLMDGWCLGIVFRQWADAYAARSRGQAAEVGKGADYGTFIHWLEKQDLRAAEAYWSEVLAGYETQTGLPRAGISLPGQEGEYRELSFGLGADATARLQALAVAHGVTLSTVFQVLWGILLHKYNNTDDAVFGSVVSGRPPEIEGIEGMVGLFINTVPVRVRIPDGRTFSQALRHLAEEALKSRMHDFYPLSDIQKRSALSQHLFDHVVAFENYPLDEQAGGAAQKLTHGWQVTGADVFERSHYPMAVSVFPGEELTLRIGYRMDTYDARVLEALPGHLRRLIDQVTENPEVEVAQIDIVTEAEQAILAGFNRPNGSVPALGSTFHGLFEAQVRRTPDALALIGGQTTLSYRELDVRANRIAGLLLSEGLQRGELVGVMADRSPETVSALLGILKAGGAYLPVDPDYPEERIRYLLTDSGVKLLLTEGFRRGGIPFEGRVIPLDDDAVLPQAGQPELPAVSAADPAYVIYTSGTTGRPKGVRVPHRGIAGLHATFIDHYGMGPGDRVLLFASLSFDASVWEMGMGLLTGAALYLAPKEVLHHPVRLQAFMADHGITAATLPPTFAVHLQPEELQSMRLVVTAGSEASGELVGKWRRHMRYINAYGPTESTVCATFWEAPGGKDAGASLIPIGRPIPGTEIQVVDRHLKPAVPGISGELCIAGIGLADGYLHRAELTAEKFVPHPYEPDRFMYRTGDLARWLPDGQLEYLGRIDHQVKIRGFRIELGEIEAALLQIRPVREAVVIDRLDAGGTKYLCAYCTFSGDELAPQELRQALLQALPDYMVPSAFVSMEQLPLTPNGKVDRKALPEPSAPAAGHAAYAAPRGEDERLFVQLWSELLGRSPESIGIDDDFFLAGGHSLKAAQLVSRIQRDFGVDLPLKAVFESPTIRGLAEAVGGRAARTNPIVPRSEKREVYPLSPGQQRIYVLEQLEAGQTGYNLPSVYRVEGHLDLHRLNEAFRALIRRHESLRTSFELLDGEPVQRIHDEVSFALELLSADQETMSRPDEPAASWIKPFDLTRAPLMRVSLVTARAEQLLFFDMHHIISDGISVQILLAELQALYRGEPLPELPLQYRDYSEWQRSAGQQESLLKMKSYWLERFAGELPVLELPTDRSRPAAQDFAGSALVQSADRSLSEGITLLAERTGTTVYMVLLAAYQILLSKYSGQEDLIIGTPAAGRTSAELEAVVGMFVGTLALRGKPQGDKSVRAYLNEVKEEALNALENGAYPFEKLVEDLQLERDVRRNPLFDVMFVYQNMDRTELELEGVRITEAEFEHRAAKLDLTLEASQEPDGGCFRFLWEFRTSLFERETVERMAGHYLEVLGQMTAEPERTVGSICLLTEAERAAMLGAWFDERPGDPAVEQSIHGLIEARAGEHPDRTAVIFGEERVTYRELNERADRLARVLAGHGLRREARVGILMHRSPRMVECILAVWKAGGAYIPVDPEYPAARTAGMLADAEAAVLLTESAHLSEELRRELGCTVLELDRLEERSAPEETAASLPHDPDALAYVIYTSGSTGRPKGAMVEHRGMMNHLLAKIEELQITERSVVAQNASHCFDISVWQFFSGGSSAAPCWSSTGWKSGPLQKKRPRRCRMIRTPSLT